MSHLSFSDTPPHDLEAEAYCLGACLQDNHIIGEVLAIVRPEHFFDELNRHAIAAIADLWHRGERADVFAVGHEVAKHALTDTPTAYLADCVTRSLRIDSVARSFASEVRAHAERRRIIENAIGIANEAWNLGDPAEVTDRAIGTLLTAYQDRPRNTSANIGDVLDTGLWSEIIEELEDPTSIRGMRSGWDELDSMLGGFENSAVYTVLADTSVGKSWFVQWLAWSVAAMGHRPLIVTTEMSRREVTRRLVYMQAGIDSLLARQNRQAADPAIARAVNEAAQQLRDERRITIVDVGKIGLDTLVSEVRRQRLLGGCDIVFLDHIQHIRVRGIRPGDTQALIAEVTSGTKAIAMNEDIPLVQVSHINRNAAFGGRPGLHGGKGGGSIEQDSNVQIELTRVWWDDVAREWHPFEDSAALKQYESKHKRVPVELRVSKSRGGGAPYSVRHLDFGKGGRWLPLAFGGGS